MTDPRTDPTMITRSRFNGRGLVQQKDHNTGENVAGWPEVAGEAARAINHLSGHGYVIAAPTAYDVLGHLAYVAHRLPQGLTQLAKGLERSGEFLTLTDCNGDPRLNLIEATMVLAEAAALAEQLAASLDDAQRLLSGQGYETDEDRERLAEELKDYEAGR